MFEHETIEDFYAAEHTELMVVTAAGDIWLAWETEDGEWWVTRPRHEDDAEGPEGDKQRPVGPSPLESLPFPIQCAPALAGFKDVHAVAVHRGCGHPADVEIPATNHESEG